MTDFSLPPLVVDHDARWIPVDLTGNLHQWAVETARDMLTRSPGRRGGSRRGRSQAALAALLETAGGMARQADDASIVLLLYPGHEDGVKAIVRFIPVDLAGRTGAEAWRELLASLPSGQPPEVTELATPAGPCRRARQPYLADDDGEPAAAEQLAYFWLLPQYGAAVVMSAAFADSLEAGRWRPALDALAATAALEQDGAEGRA